MGGHFIAADAALEDQALFHMLVVVGGEPRLRRHADQHRLFPVQEPVLDPGRGRVDPVGLFGADEKASALRGRGDRADAVEEPGPTSPAAF